MDELSPNPIICKLLQHLLGILV